MLLERIDTEPLRFERAIAANGWAVTDPIVDASTVSELRECLAPLARAGRGGARNLLDEPRIAGLAAAPPLHRLASAVLGDSCFAVRALFFDKTPDANWKVVWHQDLTIATRRRVDASGFGPWTEKAGVPHVQPQIDILEHMLALRLHLDPCTVDNGPVRAINGTHRFGRIAPEEIDRIRAERPESVCLAAEGAVLAFRPLLLHASSLAERPVHRRVIHVEYAARPLPPPLAWHRRIA
jgi:ectoine hydroxylase-related dioxygenase (phytanoyl-CoA dioxygenase family)